MIDIHGNYRGNVTLRRLCAHCEEEEDTTEHLPSCKVFLSEQCYLAIGPDKRQ